MADLDKERQRLADFAEDGKLKAAEASGLLEAREMEVIASIMLLPLLSLK